ncbi:MAG: aminofutalosine synthase MqnE [Bacteroidota bacterium]|jgi:aminodeoxyfutalosine synthase
MSNSIFIQDPEMAVIANKILTQEPQRITPEEGVMLFKKGSLPFLGMLANHIREKKHGNNTYFNRNFHIEPTNVCVFSCAFCAYSKLYANKEEGWELSIDQMLEIVKKYNDKQVTEVHIVGGVHPKMNMAYFTELIGKIREVAPHLHIKAFTAVELDYMFRKAKLSVEDGLKQLKLAGLQSLPGGGAEIFHPEVREKIAGDKVTGEGWLNIHETAHQLGIPSNATLLYGHIETAEHRIDHMLKLRDLQDKTGGFNTFIPLKFRNENNDMSHIPESTQIEDLKMYAISRIFLDNFPHIKAYWPMLGRNQAQMTLSFGVNDLDGTIDDSTKIYSMAGSEEQNPSMTTEQLVQLIHQAGRQPVERDTLYQVIQDFGMPHSMKTN